MIPEIGHLALVIALGLAILQSFYGIAGAQRNDQRWMGVVRPVACGQFVFVAISFLCLAASFVRSDFSVQYVAENSNTHLPLIYKISAVWGAHEGSLLLWVLILAVWTLAVALFSRKLPQAFVARVLGVMGMVAIGFMLFTLLTSNPFTRLLPSPAQGRDLNPILQDPALAMHPPMLYVGYVGFSVAFAFAVAALIGGRMDAVWARWSRPWTTVAWLFLTMGITLGSWWAYYELGWGGWWFWDPVENASFMPWLVGTALMHSLAVTEKRGAFKSWTALLAIAAFSLSLLGTFLVRSGVLISVHAFATDPTRGIFVLALIGIVVGAALLLYAWRAPSLTPGGGFQIVSRESLLLMNNVLLVVAAAAVLLGTLYPLFIDALHLGKISVGPPYFDRVFVPIVLPLIAIIGLGPYTNWKRGHAGDTFKRIRVPLVIAVVVTLLVAFAMWSDISLPMLAGVCFGAWALGTAFIEIISRVRRKRAGGRASLPRSLWGMSFAHFGAGLLVLGVTVTSTLSIARDSSMHEGDAMTLHGYTFTLQKVHEIQGPNYTAERADIRVTHDGKFLRDMHPEKRVYDGRSAPTTESAIDPGLTRDLYVALGSPLGDNAWSVRIQYKPFVRFIWLGGIFMALGGILAVSDKRYRQRAAGEGDA